jgi:Fibronectin type III domain
MRLQYVGRALASIAGVATLACGAAMAQTPEQVQYLPRDGAVIVTWMAPSGNVTGYNVYQSTVDSPTAQPSSPTKVNTDPIKETSFMVQALKNGTCYHITVSAIVDGKESAAVGPQPTHRDPPEGTNVCAVPQAATKLAGAGDLEFYGHNIGTNYPGSHKVDANGVITMTASGWDIWENSDGFYFLATPIEGNVTITARVVSGPTPIADGGNGWELGGPMIRESLDARSRFAMMQISQGRDGTHHQFKKREEFDTTPVNDDSDDDSFPPEERPIWARLQRTGDDFHGFVSKDGKDFTEVGSGDTISDFAKTAYVGLALTAHNQPVMGEYTTAVFDNVTVAKQ